MIKIDNRLKAVANQVEKTNIFADVGSDHGYLPLYLLENNLIKKAIVSELNPSPLENSRKNIRGYNLENRCEFIISDGLKNLSGHNIEAFSICGMGGHLIKDIITNGDKVIEECKYFILQPMNNVELLRRFLYENDFKIIKEDIIKDKHFYYNILKVKKEKDDRIYDDIFFELSYDLYINKHKLFLEYLNFKIEIYEKILTKPVKNNKIMPVEDRKKIEEKLNKIRKVKRDYESL